MVATHKAKFLLTDCPSAHYNLSLRTSSCNSVTWHAVLRLAEKERFPKKHKQMLRFFYPHKPHTHPQPNSSASSIPLVLVINQSHVTVHVMATKFRSCII